MVNSPLIRPAISWGGSFGGGTLDSHDVSSGKAIGGMSSRQSCQSCRDGSRHCHLLGQI